LNFPKVDLNLAMIWTAVTVTFSFALGAITYASERFATKDEVRSFAVEVLYESYYKSIDRMREAEARGDDDRVTEEQRNAERIKAKICAAEPEWIRCKQ